MLKLKQAVIVEGKYDKIKLENIIDAPIIVTNGFAVFKDKQKMNYIREVAKKRGIIIMTDSDSAGAMIRSHIVSCVPGENITNIFLPDVFGKEHRKRKPSKEGKLGVEGIDDGIIAAVLEKAGVTADTVEGNRREVTKTDLFTLGLSGTTDSSIRRQQLQKKLNLPQQMTTNMLLDAINTFYSYNEFMSIFSDF